VSLILYAIGWVGGKLRVDRRVRRQCPRMPGFVDVPRHHPDHEGRGGSV